jgi:hypothetical protein
MVRRDVRKDKRKPEEREYNADTFRKEEAAVIAKTGLKQDTRVYPTLWNECANCGTRYPLLGNVDFDFCNDRCVDERIRRSLYVGA